MRRLLQKMDDLDKEYNWYWHRARWLVEVREIPQRVAMQRLRESFARLAQIEALMDEPFERWEGEGGAVY